MKWRRAAIAFVLLCACAKAEEKPSSEPALDPDALYGEARAAAKAQRYDEAESRFRALAEKYPDNPDYLLGLGQALLAQGRVKEAVNILERARALAPQYLDVLQVLAQAYRASGDPDAARRTYVAALSQAPEAEWARVGLATLARTGQSRVTVALGSETTYTERDDTWHESGIAVEYSWAPRSLLGIRAARSERFELDDDLFEFYASVPATRRITVSGRGQFSSTHRARLEHAGFLEAALALKHGYVVSLGGGRTDYTIGPSDSIAASIERYVGDYRLAYTLTMTDPEGAGWSAAHRWSVSRYYAHGSHVGVALGFGKETDVTVTGSPALEFDSWGGGIGGRHWLNDHIALDYGLGYTGLESETGDHLDRTTLHVGVAARF
ncbi:MAG: YaiO family outer membrane beta-barrel protein [Chromatiales bacterium]